MAKVKTMSLVDLADLKRRKLDNGRGIPTTVAICLT
jgi:hypothetical protein